MNTNARCGYLLVVIVTLAPLACCLSFLNFILPLKQCTSSEFKCNDGTCIETDLICDGIANCVDGSDEFNSSCYFRHCVSPSYYRCGDGSCINMSSLCNTVPDCKDGSDEAECENGKGLATCSKNFFTCTSDAKCIPMSWVCDKRHDCMDGSDETVECLTIKRECGKYQFMCRKTKECIPKTFRCDGVFDCNDKSDEEHCEHKPINLTNCTLKNGLYGCKDSYKCISIFKVCDSKIDCYDKSDEGDLCLHTECQNCNHTCKSTPTGGACLCSEGFQMTDNNECRDINECESYGVCDQICINLKGSFTCSCEVGYSLMEDKRTCSMKGEEGVLIYTARDTIKGVNLKTLITRTYLDKLPATVGVSAFGKYIYWTTLDGRSSAIMRVNEDDLKSAEMIVTNGLGTPEDLAVDWITQNIYFTDKKFKHIAVCSSDGFVCTVLHSKYVDKPRSITVVPRRGIMFWTDWGEKPFIGRSGMDGSNSIEFVAADIDWPNGIAFDEPNERVYWVDAKLERIETIKLDQSDRRTVLSQSIRHPFSIEVFEDKLYWSDIEGKEILSCNKFSGKDRRSVARETFEKIYGIHVRHPLLEQTILKNPCTGSRKKCSDLCLLTPSMKELNSSCACPYGKDLANDDVTCIEKVSPPTVVIATRDQIFIVEHTPLGRHKQQNFVWSDMDISAITYDSRKNMLLVADLSSRTIFSFDVHSRSLEPFITYGLGPIGSMEYDEFGNNLYWCDEDTLSIEVISLTTFSRKVILSGTPFKNFPADFALVPERGFMFVVLIIAARRIQIDRISMDGNEESRKSVFSYDGFSPDTRVHYSKELKRLFWVDTAAESIESIDLDGNDRQRFVTSSPPYTLTSTGGILFWSTIGSSVVSWHNFYTDEFSENLNLNVDASKFKYYQFARITSPDSNMMSPCLINNGGCSDLCLASTNENENEHQVCSCPIGTSLSVNQSTCVRAKQCSLEEFECFTGECIPISHVCNNKYDCVQGDDERLEHCSEPRCPSDQFLCADKKRCIDRKSKCDGHHDCDDGSDEICHVICNEGQFLCDTGECVDTQFRCDGKVDCKQGYDEHNCTEVTCNGNQFRCSSGQCIPREWECDRETDCVDGSDESENCERTSCFSNEFQCSNNKCVDVKLTCNGVDDCGDDSDEELCKSSKPFNIVYKLCNVKKEFYCPSNQHRHCIPISARCNGTVECVKGEDEENCNSDPCIFGEEFYCVRDSKCIPQEWVCDRHPDCSDGADEAKHACLVKPTKGTLCAGFQCDNGQCIQLSNVCDNISHCSDGSDEGGKCDTSCQPDDCSQKCFRTPKGSLCLCKAGYKLAVDGITCQDVNECDLNICSQNCTNLQGGFTCNCFSAEYKLRSDRVSCKAVGASMVFVVASQNMVVLNSNNMKHTSELSAGTNAFDTILSLDADNSAKHIYILTENDIVMRTSVGRREEKTQIRLSQITEFTFDWINKIIYFIAKREKIQATAVKPEWIKDQKLNVVQLYKNNAAHLYAIAVDPVAGYLFWFEYYTILASSSIGSIKRADCTGMNVLNLTTPLNYGIHQLVVDSFDSHLYWMNYDSTSVQRMNYDGSGVETVFKSDDKIRVFTLFENSIYSVSLNQIPIRKCKIYGLPPKKCETFKSNLHDIRHLTILQENRQKIVNNLCENKNCSELCLLSPEGAKCVCDDGRIPSENECPSSAKDRVLSASVAHFVNGERNTVGHSFAYFVILCLIIGLAIIAYRQCKPKAEILHRLHFHCSGNSVPNSFSDNTYSSENLIDRREYIYENSMCDIPIRTTKLLPRENETEEEKNKRLYLETLEEENRSKTLSSNHRTSKESLIKY